jgi:replicative DNA helicase
MSLADDLPSARPATDTAHPKMRIGDSVFDKVNALPIEEVLSWLGVETRSMGSKTIVKCPNCGAYDDTSSAIVEGGVKCLHASCSDAGPVGAPGFRTAVDLAMVVRGHQKPIDAVKDLAAAFGIEMPERRERTGTQGGPPPGDTSDEPPEGFFEDEPTVSIALVGEPPEAKPAPAPAALPRVFTEAELLQSACQRAASTTPRLVCSTGSADLDRMTGGFLPGWCWVVGANTNWGKCLAPDTRVMRADGTSTEARNVVVGDDLMGPGSSPRRVLTTTRGTAPMYRIVPKRGEPWGCNGAHVLTVVSTMTGEVRDISVDEYLRLPVTTRMQQKLFHVGWDYPTAEPPKLDPWFAGVWFGDGAKALTCVSVTSEDWEIVDGLRETASTWGLHVNTYAKKDNHASAYALCGARAGDRNGLLDELRVLFGDGSALPTAYTEGSRETRLGFLAGMIDSDGYAKGRRFCEIVTKTERWATQLRLLCRSLGLQAHVYRKTGIPGYEDRTYWRLHICGDLSVIPTRVARKRFPCVKGKDVTRVGFTVEPCGPGEYCGFAIDGDHRFLLADGTVTHNSTWAVAVADTNLQAGRGVLIVSLEDSHELYGDRLLLRRARRSDDEKINADHLRLRRMTMAELELADRVRKEALPRPMFLDARGRKGEWIAKALAALLDGPHRIDLVIVDYLGEVRSGSKQQDRRNEVSEMAALIRGVVKRRDRALILLSQVTVGEDPDKFPRMNQIRDSRDVVNAAEVVAMCGIPPNDMKDKNGNVRAAAGERAMLLEKVKQGRKGWAQLHWDDESASFVDVVDDRTSDTDPREPPLGRSWSPGAPAPAPYHEPQERDEYGVADGFGGLPRN